MIGVRFLARLMALLVALTVVPQGARANCRLALALALDVSSSVDADEYALQRGGLASALLDPEVQSILLGTDGYFVALAVYEWSGRYQSAIVLDWIVIKTQADILRAAETIARTTRSQDKFPTALGYALGFGATLLANGPPCAQHKIDVSGDGPNNEGFRPANAYTAFPFANVTVNGLAIETKEGGLADYYRREVAHGPGAFVISANGYRDFKRAMTLKLLRELSDMLMSDAGAAPTRNR